jgi:hypothetical protein
MRSASLWEVFDENPGPVIDFVRCGVYDLLRHVSVDTRQADDTLDELPIGFGIVGSPAAETTEAAAHVVVVAGEDPLGLLLGADGHYPLIIILVGAEALPLISKQTGGQAEEQQSR